MLSVASGRRLLSERWTPTSTSRRGAEWDLSLPLSRKSDREPRHRFRIYARIALLFFISLHSRERRGEERERERIKACESLKGPTGKQCYRVVSFYCFAVGMKASYFSFPRSYFSVARSSTTPVYLLSTSLFLSPDLFLSYVSKRKRRD